MPAIPLQGSHTLQLGAMLAHGFDTWTASFADEHTSFQYVEHNESGQSLAISPVMENILSGLMLVGLLVFFRKAFQHYCQEGDEKRENNRSFYGSQSSV